MVGSRFARCSSSYSVFLLSYYLVTILCEIGLDGYIGSVVIAIINVVICFIVTPTLANLVHHMHKPVIVVCGMGSIHG